MMWFVWGTFILAGVCWLLSRMAKKPASAISWKIEAALWFLVAIFLAVVSNGR